MKRTARYIDSDLADPAVLCVEILTPGQAIANLIDKADRLLKAGTPVCWLIWPERRRAWIYTREDLREATESLVAQLSGGDVAAVPAAEMWTELDEAPEHNTCP